MGKQNSNVAIDGAQPQYTGIVDHLEEPQRICWVQIQKIGRLQAHHVNIISSEFNGNLIACHEIHVDYYILETMLVSIHPKFFESSCPPALVQTDPYPVIKGRWFARFRVVKRGGCDSRLKLEVWWTHSIQGLYTYTDTMVSQTTNLQ